VGLLMKTMNPKEFLEKCLSILELDDPEYTHGELDSLVEDLLCELGYQDGINVIRKTTRWYA